ncbi:MAG: rhodanese-like domain-containing protein [Pseudomonadota bacterium]
MNQYLDFFIAHWEYSLLFIAAFIWVIIAQINDRKANLWGVQPQNAVELINRQSAIVFDLRDATAFAQGHIVGAKRVDLKLTDDPKAILKITPQTNCLFVCATGQTSSKVVSTLRAKGYASTYTLSGGIASWEKENLPLIKGK